MTAPLNFTDMTSAEPGTVFTDREGDTWVRTRRGFDLLVGRGVPYSALEMDDALDEFGPFRVVSRPVQAAADA